MGKYIVRIAVCCVVYDSCAQQYAYKYEQFLKLCLVRVRLDYVCVCFLRFSLYCVFFVGKRSVFILCFFVSL